MRVGRTLLLCSPLVWGLLACQPQRERPPEEIATLGDEPVLYGEWKEHLARVAGGGAAGLDSEVLSSLLDQYLEERLLLLLGQEMEWVRREVSLAEQRLDLLAELARVDVSEEQVGRWLEHHGLPREEERVRLLHLTYDQATAAEAALGALNADGTEAWLAEHPTHEVTEIPSHRLPTAFAEAVADLDLNRRGTVLVDQKGHTVLWLVERQPARVLSEFDAQELTRRQLRTAAAAEKRSQLAAEARDRYNPRVWQQNLPFDYTGSYADPS